jgi:hypothetical protein
MRVHLALRIGANEVTFCFKYFFDDHLVIFVSYFLHNIKFTNYDLHF